MAPKVITPEQAAALIGDKSSVVLMGSGGGIGEPTAVLRAIGARYQQEQHPQEITITHCTGLGDQKDIGTELLAHPGLVKRDVAGHLGMAPGMARLISDNQVEGYNFPQGVLSHMMQAVAGRKPGVITKVGLGTFVDPRLEGGRMNEITTEELVRVIELDGEEWLYWPRFHFDVAVVRGTTADTRGNITSREEGVFLEGINVAQAARACGGVVIAQVKYLAQSGSLNPQEVKIPGIYVDYIVVDPEQKQTVTDFYNPAYTGAVRVPLESIAPLPPGPRRIIALRAARELFEGAVVNLGFGMPDGIAAVAAEQGMLEKITLTVEQGAVGGRPAGGVIFGVAYNPEAVISQADQFTFYDGGGLDVAFLGMAQADKEGNVNTSKVGKRLTGCGGFINITQSARKVVYCGTFTARGLEVEISKGTLTIVKEGEIRKFVTMVDQVTYSGETGRRNEQPVMYVTERAVFELQPDGVVLTEIAPGVDVQRDILDQMNFKPAVSEDLKIMDPEFFQ